MKMNPRVKKKWLAALRSRKFKQAQNRFRVGDRYCCLGVLCEISKLGKWSNELDFWDDDREIMDYTTPKDVNNDATGFGVYLWAGLDIEAIGILANMNDSGKKFYQIARWIERNL